MHLKLLKKTAHVALLSDYSVLKVTGRDAQSFMHRQFTQNIASLNTNRCVLSSFCQHEGKVLALFWVIFINEAFYIIINRSNTPFFIRYLSRYILRDDVSIKDETTKYFILGLLDENNDFSLDIGAATQNEASIIVRLPNRTNKSCALMMVNCHETLNVDTINQLKENFKDDSFWHIYQIYSLFPDVSEKTTNRFTAKQLQLDRLGVISNNKGCYPGHSTINKSLEDQNSKYTLQQGFITTNKRNGSSIEIKNTQNKTVGFILLTQKTDDGKELILATIEEPISTSDNASYFIDNQAITWIKS